MSSNSENEDLLSPGLLPHASEDLEDRGLDLVAILAAILSEWKVGVVTFLVTAIACFAFVFSLKPQYVATATILPQESHGADATLFSLFSTRGPGALYIGLLKSRSVQDVVIRRANLLDLFKTTSFESARGSLAARSSFSEGADSLIVISVKDTNAQNAARIAEAYLDGLNELNQKTSLEQSKLTNDLFESQLKFEKDELTNAEGVLAQTQTRTGLIQSEAQTSIGLNAIAATRSQINNLNAQLAALRQSATEQNPEVVRLRSELNQLEAQERAMESSGHTPAGAAPSAGDIPKTTLDIARAQRQVRYHDTLVNSLATQFANARLAQDLSQSAFQVIDHAVPPEHKDWPPRKPFLIASFAFAGFVALIAILCVLLWRRITSDPEHRASLTALKQAFGTK